jgi:hypothetical protein
VIPAAKSCIFPLNVRVYEKQEDLLIDKWYVFGIILHDHKSTDLTLAL